MKKKIIVVHTRDISEASRMMARRPFSWLYLGQDIKQRENISQALGKGNRYFLGNLLQEVARQEKQPFLDFIAELGLHQQNKLHWWASNIAYKNPLASDFFLLWCYAAIFEKVCLEREWGEEKLLIVFVQDLWLYRYLWQRYKENRNSFSFLSRKSIILELLKLITRGIASRGYFLLKAGYQIWKSKDIISRSKISDSVRNERKIYIYSWIENRFFKKDGKFEDAYLGRLQEIIKDSGPSVTYITPPFLTPDLKKKCLGYGKCKFIFLDRYINFQSILRSSFSFFRISLTENLSSRFPSLKTLLQRETIHELPSFASNILYYLAFKEWLKEVKQKEMIIIYSFENQPWDKMLCIAAKESDEDIKLIGYQHSMVPLLLLNYFLGIRESGIMPLPDCIVTNGEYTLNLLKNAGYGETELVNGGALRYEHLYKMDKNLVKKDKISKAVLVALPGSRIVTEELLIALFDAFEDLSTDEFRFVVKFHPDLSLERLKIELPPWPAHFQKTDKSISKILKEVDLVIYSSSTVGLEALLNGIPVVRYHSEHILDLDPLDVFNKEIVKSCSEDNLRQVVLSALKEGSNYLSQQSALNSLNKFFSPVEEDMWRQIVEL